MKFREIVDSPCGIRYLFDELELQSGYARKRLLDKELMTRPEDIRAAYESLSEYARLVREERKQVEDICFRLQGLRDITGTLTSLAEGAVLDEIELFEIKHLAMLAESLGVGEEMDRIIAILDPDGLKIATFYIYDSYSVTLRSLRSRLEVAPDDADLREELMNEEDRIRQQVSTLLQPFAARLRSVLEALGELDIVIAKAIQMNREGLVIPSIADSTSVRGMFHPEVRAILARRSRTFQCVDFDFRMGVPATIIGANMGGKTVVLKTLCLMQYLFQFGFALPAAEARMAIYDEIAFCIGDEQSEQKGLSSFAAEMVRIDRMLDKVESGVRVLALVDEPARTTNPVEGSALVSALLGLLADKKNLTLVLTTHYQVENAGQCWRVRGLKEGTGGLQMDYGLMKTASNDVPHEALNIAREIGIHPAWIQKADTIMKRQYEQK